MKTPVLVVLGISLSASLTAQTQAHLGAGQNITGQLVLSGTVNLMQQAKAALALGGIPQRPLGANQGNATVPPAPLRPPMGWHPGGLGSQTPTGTGTVPMQSMAISSANTFGLMGLTHYQQREANGANQWSVEPPNPSIAVGNGMVLEGVNNAVQVYNTAGTALLPAVLSSNQVFGLAPAIVWNTGVNGVFPTDMRVYFDAGINRWFIIQRAQDNDAFGDELDSSHLYMAVSQSNDPTGTYNIYIMDTTDASNTAGCPCFPDYPQIGSDQYGFYIASNEFDTSTGTVFVDAQIFAISKAALAAGTTKPTIVKYLVQDVTGYEFAIQPVTTPTGASYFVASGGVEYFVSTDESGSINGGMAVWALSNTQSLANSPALNLTETITPILTYSMPGFATEMSGPLTYGPSQGYNIVPALDGGDCRVLSAFYSGGRIYLSFQTQVVDELGNSLVGGAYVILSPTFRNNVLAAPVLRQGYLLVQKNHLLRPAIGVTAQGRGAIAMTLAGPNYFPSAAYVTIDTYSTGSAVQLVAAGGGPEDGFTGYPPNSNFVARWGDYNTAAVNSDGSIWMTTEYIPGPSVPRTPSANWGTFITRYQP